MTERRRRAPSKRRLSYPKPPRGSTGYIVFGDTVLILDELSVSVDRQGGNETFVDLGCNRLFRKPPGVRLDVDAIVLQEVKRRGGRK